MRRFRFMSGKQQLCLLCNGTRGFGSVNWRNPAFVGETLPIVLATY